MSVDPAVGEPAVPPAAARPHPVIGWRAYAAATGRLAKRASDLRAIWLGERLDPAFREELMVAVAAVNSCRQCSFAHREWALAEGLPADELAALEGMEAASFDERKWAAIAWAQAATRGGFTDIPDAIDENLRAQYSAQEQADIELVANTMCWLNRTSNTVDAAWSRLHGEPSPGSSVTGELAAVAIYAVVAPALLAVVSVKQRRNPISLIASIGPFFREFEARSR